MTLCTVCYPMWERRLVGDTDLRPPPATLHPDIQPVLWRQVDYGPLPPYGMSWGDTCDECSRTAEVTIE